MTELRKSVSLEPSGRATAAEVFRRKRLKNVLLILAGLILSGLALGFIASPFAYLLFLQAAGIVLAVVVLVSIRRDPLLLAAAAAWLAAFLVRQTEPATALAAFFAAAFVGRSLLPDGRGRRLFSLAALLAAGLGLGSCIRKLMISALSLETCDGIS